MKIVIANKYYHISGGPEKYLFGLSEHLKPLGHDVIPFSLTYERNEPSEYKDYFLEAAGGGEETKLYKIRGGISTKFRIAARSIYSLQARDSLEKLITDTDADILYCLNIVNHMSPSIIDAAHRKGIPSVMRLSDYNLVCANYLYLRDDRVCTDCERGFHHALIHKCVYGSLSATAVRVSAMWIHKALRIYNKVGAFVTPAMFMRNTLIRNGYPAEKIHYIPTFVDAHNWVPRYDNDGYVLYFGRLTPEKGIEFLLRSYITSGISDPLMVVGECPNNYMDEVKSRVGESNLSKVSFLGLRTGEELRNIVRGAKYVVVPSLCYDNSPNVVYESFAAGKPVIGSALGGLCEQISDDTGELVEPGNTVMLAEAMTRLSQTSGLVGQLGRNARAKVEREHSVETHMERLLTLFQQLISEKC